MANIVTSGLFLILFVEDVTPWLLVPAFLLPLRVSSWLTFPVLTMLQRR